MNRLGFVGASDIPIILGLSTFKSARELWLEKTEQVPPWEGNLRTDVGTALENLIVSLACKKLGVPCFMFQQEFAPKSEPWFQAHVDATGAWRGEKVIVEAKTCAFAKRDGGWGAEGSEMVPASYFVQVQAQMHAARLCGEDISTAFIACLFLNRLGDGREKQPQVFPVKYDQAVAERAIAKGREFWKFVETKTWPIQEEAA